METIKVSYEKGIEEHLLWFLKTLPNVKVTKEPSKTKGDETAYLSKSPKNKKRLDSAIAELESGKGIKKGLAE